MYNNALECIKLVGIVWKVGTLKTLKINNLCRMTLFTDQNNTFNYEVNMSYITFLLLFFKSFYFSKQLHSAKVFNNQQFNLLYFIHNTYHFYTLFTFIIHKIQLFTIQQPKLAKLYHKRAVQILSKKIFQGCTTPIRNSPLVYPRSPSGIFGQ